MSRARLLAALLLGLLAACGEPRRPPLILIVVDTLRATQLEQYGYARPTSGALERLASRATRFSRCSAPAPWTTPSTASILTGLQPWRHGADFRGAALSPEAHTLAECLQSAGWRTVGISLNYNVSATTGFQQGFEWFDGFEGESGVYPDIATLCESVGRLRWDGPRPLFLYLQPMNTHGPYRVPEAHAADLLGAAPDPGFRYGKGAMKAIMKEGGLAQRSALDPAYVQSQRDQYDSAVRYTMDQLGLVLERLEAEGVFDEALVVLTSDHGEELFDHQGFGHGYSLYEDVLHVPLFIKLPGQRQARVVEECVSLVDLMPTILDALGLEAPAQLDGRSLLPQLLPLSPEDDDSSRPVYFANDWPGRMVGRGVVAWPWKLIQVSGNYEGLHDAERLYHLGDDPRETRDLSADRPEVARSLRELLSGFDVPGDATLPALDVGDRMDQRTLEALGYLR